MNCTKQIVGSVLGAALIIGGNGCLFPLFMILVVALAAWCSGVTHAPPPDRLTTTTQTTTTTTTGPLTGGPVSPSRR